MRNHWADPSPVAIRDLPGPQNLDLISRDCCGSPMVVERVGVYHPLVRIEVRCAVCQKRRARVFDVLLITAWLNGEVASPDQGHPDYC